jgi:D-alanyl-lipoteichoic acid acyltransferase DltB (MBOAT superfamily)
VLFVEYAFLFFLLMVLVGRWALPVRATGPFLLSVSILFYMAAGPAFVLLLLGLALWSFLVGLWLEGADRPRWLAAIGIALGLAPLAVFKYTAFIAAQAAWLLGSLGLHPPSVLSTAVPLGLSFYTFQALSYILDVYRGRPAEHSFLLYACYATYFPHLVAGPIVRADELLPQLRTPAAFDADRFASGLGLLLQGFVKKCVFADRLSAFADPIFQAPAGRPGLELWLAAFAYAGQIYCDFSGYTDIARGAAAMLGVHLPENFRLPYLARSPREFWQRWHITLSTWLRDYLYIPLGGRRHGPVRGGLNALVTMALGGLWHGAHWHFVAWGAWNGLLLVAHRAIAALVPDRIRRHSAWGALGFIATLLGVVLGWVLFRAPDLSAAGVFFDGLFQSGLPAAPLEPLCLLGLLALGHALGLSGRFGATLRTLLGATGEARTFRAASETLAGALLRGAAFAVMLAAIYFFGAVTAPFIYFEF